MASVEIIGLLCAGSTRYHNHGGRSGASDQLSRSELAGLLSGLDRTAMNLALAKYAGDLGAERMLIANIRVWAAGIAVRESWKIVKGRPCVANMAALAVFDVVRHNRCCRCSGRGVMSNRVCTGCNGSGYRPLTGRKLAEAIGIDEATYRKQWRVRYEYCLDYVQNIDSEVNRAVSLSDRKYG